jgi:hypothetical protein
MNDRFAATAARTQVGGHALIEVVAAGVLLAVSFAAVFGAPIGFAALAWMQFTQPETFGIDRDLGLYCAAC